MFGFQFPKDGDTGFRIFLNTEGPMMIGFIWEGGGAGAVTPLNQCSQLVWLGFTEVRNFRPRRPYNMP